MPTSAPAPARPSRKRRSRKAKPPEGVSPASQMNEDPQVREGTEDSECCNEKKGKQKCAACAEGKPCSGRDDSITGAEYLIAADLGIVDRPRPYIRARLDAMKKPGGAGGKKCGASYIAASATCHNGQGGAPASQGGSRLRKGLETAGMVGGGALAVGGLVQGARLGYGKGNYKGAHRALAASNLGTALMGAAQVSKGKRTGDKDLVKSGKASIGTAAALGAFNLTASGDAGRAARGIGNAMKNRGPKALPTSSLAKPKPSMRTRAGNAAYKAAYGAGRAAGTARRAAQSATARVAETMGRRNARRGSVTVRSSQGWRSTAITPYSSRNVGKTSLWRRRDSIWADGFSPESEALLV